MSVSFGFLDFDNFDFEFYDIEKLCNFLEILDDRLFQDMVGFIFVIESDNKISFVLDDFIDFKFSEKVTLSCQQCREKLR